MPMLATVAYSAIVYGYIQISSKSPRPTILHLKSVSIKFAHKICHYNNIKRRKNGHCISTCHIFTDYCVD